MNKKMISNLEKIKLRNKEYYQKHRTEYIARVKKWAGENKNKIMIYKGRYREKNREKLREKNRKYNKTPQAQQLRKEYYFNNKAKFVARATDWRKIHNSRRKEIVKKWESLNRDKVNIKARKYRHTEKGRVRARYYNQKRRTIERDINIGYTKKEFLELIKNTNGICPACKKLFTKEFHSKNELTIEHNLPISKAPKGYIYTIKDISILCRSCNAKKGNRMNVS